MATTMAQFPGLSSGIDMPSFTDVPSGTDAALGIDALRQFNVKRNRLTDERTNGQTDERTNGRTDKRTNRRTDERTNVSMSVKSRNEKGPNEMATRLIEMKYLGPCKFMARNE